MNKQILNVAYSFDDGYAQHAGISILSLLENNQDIEHIVFYIITNALSQDNRKRIETIIKQYHRELHYLDLDELTSDLKISTNFNRSAYGRIFLPNAVQSDSIVYVDSDTVITKSLKELFDIDMSDKLVAGVQDTVNSYYVINIGLNNNHRYINDGGIIVLNLDLWRKMGIVKKCIDFIYKFNGNPPHNDQGTINHVCAVYIEILPANYNVMAPMFNFTSKQIRSLFKMKQYYSQSELDNAIQHPIVIHYTDEFFNRPWFSNCTHPLKHLYLEFKEKSPWKDSPLKYKELSKNCKIQNWVYAKCPFFVYKLMIRFIEYKHRLKK